jgi:transporter family-2 protein
MLSTAIGLALMLTVRGSRGQIDLSAPLHRTEVWVAMFALTAVLLTLSMRGIAPGFAIVGLFGLAFIAGAAFLIPEIGVSGFVVGATAGTLIAALTLDHTGAFGIDVREVSLLRVSGVALALVGAVIVSTDT